MSSVETTDFCCGRTQVNQCQKCNRIFGPMFTPTSIQTELTVARAALVQAKEAINAVYVMIKKRGGIHSRLCAVFPQEIPRSGPFHDPYTDNPPQYTQKGPCNCGLVAMDKQANDAVDAIDAALEQ